MSNAVLMSVNNRVVKDVMKVSYRAVVSCLIALVVLFALALQRSQSSSKALKPTVIDFDCGQIQSRHRLERTVKIGNPTMHPLTVRRLTASCGCISPSLSVQRIEPGAEADLSFAYEAGKAPGPFHQQIDIAFHETSIPITVKLHGTVVSWYTRIGGTFSFGDVIAGTTSSEQQIEIELAEDCPESEIQLTQVPPQLSIGTKNPTAGGKRISLRASYSAPAEGQYGRHSGEVIFQWKGYEERRLTLPWSATVVTPTELVPRLANFGVLDSELPRRVEVSWRQREFPRLAAQELMVKPHLFGDALKISFSDIREGEVRIELTLSPDLLMEKGVIEGVVDVSTFEGKMVARVPWIAFNSSW